MSKGDEVTVGFRYLLGVHFILCHGPVDEFREIEAGGRTAYRADPGDITDNTRLEIDEEELFGGEDREGGVEGELDVEFGGDDQQPNDYLQSVIDGPVPAHRGVLGVVLRQMYIGANNPYLKEWAFKVKRCITRDDGEDPWYPQRAEIGDDMNPAHILVEVLTNQRWGMGEPLDEIDQDSFEDAADQLHSEEFGLSFLWNYRQSANDFIRMVLDHIDAALYTDPESGKWTLKLIRGDYDRESLPLFDESDIIELDSFSRSGEGENPNELTLQFKDQSAGKDRSVTVHDVASLQRQGSRIATEVKMPGITREDLAIRVASRELQQRSIPLGKCRVVGNRRFGQLRPGDAVRIKWTPAGIDDVVMRVGEIDYGTLVDGSVSVELIEDVFGREDAIYSDTGGSQWESPNRQPDDAPAVIPEEAPYYLVSREILRGFGEDSESLTEGAGFLTVMARKPSPDAMDYRVQIDAGAGYQDAGRGGFGASGYLLEDLPAEVTSTVNLEAPMGLRRAQPGDLGIVDGEWVVVRDVDAAVGQVTVDRGVLDTTPARHAAGEPLIIRSGSGYLRVQEFADGESLEVKVLPQTGRGRLDPDSATAHGAEMDQRLWRPYPPGNLQVAGEHYPDSVATTGLEATWSHRDRKEQTGSDIVPQDEGDIGPEPGVEYLLEVVDLESSDVLDSLTTSGTSYEDQGHQATTTSESAPWHIAVRVSSQRDGLTSWQANEARFTRKGYGFCFQDNDHINYGGYDA